MSRGAISCVKRNGVPEGWGITTEGFMKCHGRVKYIVHMSTKVLALDIRLGFYVISFKARLKLSKKETN